MKVAQHMGVSKPPWTGQDSKSCFAPLLEWTLLVSLQGRVCALASPMISLWWPPLHVGARFCWFPFSHFITLSFWNAVMWAWWRNRCIQHLSTYTWIWRNLPLFQYRYHPKLPRPSSSTMCCYSEREPPTNDEWSLWIWDSFDLFGTPAKLARETLFSKSESSGISTGRAQIHTKKPKYREITLAFSSAGWIFKWQGSWSPKSFPFFRSLL